jgi:predicted lysophospholipase L1 biosynthesis ABC-type transport system permease subunit
MSIFKLIIDNTRRDLSDGDGRISTATQTALMLFLLTLTLVSVSIQDYLSENLTQMLGSDMVIESQTELSDDEKSTVESKSSGLSSTILSDVTLTYGQRWAQVQLKQVDETYPLQGMLQIGDTPASPAQTVNHGPDIGDIWLGSRLATKLATSVGDSITLGGINLRVGAILFHEPDRLMEGHSVAMRAMVHAASLDKTTLASSKQRFRYLIMANDDARNNIETWVKDTLPGSTLLKKHGDQHPLASFWKRTENFLGLASVILFFMGAVAIDMTNRRWLAKMRYRLAIYASFGTRNRTGAMIALGSWFISFLLAVFIATILAILAQGIIFDELQSYFPGLKPSWALYDAAKTIFLVFILLVALMIPSFAQLRHASLLSLIRSHAAYTYLWQRLIGGLVSVSLLAVAYSDNWLLTAMTLTAVTVSLAFIAVLTWCVVRLGDTWGRRRSGLLPFAFYIMRQRIFAKSAQVMGLGLCGLMLLFTLMLMRDFGTMLEGYTRAHDGNLLISEAQEEQINAIHTWAEKTDTSIRAMRPFVSAQLIAVNGQSLADYAQKPSDTLATLQSPIRLSWSDKMPANNRLSGGRWWEQDTKKWQQISTEPEVMTDMGLSYGDILKYKIGDNLYDFTLTASHVYKPGHGSITFWFQIPETARAHIDAPTHFMGSMELPDSAWDALTQLWQEHPSLSLVPLRELTERFDDTLGIITKVTNGYAAMVLLLAIFVLAASVSGFRADDQLKNGLLMTMGLRQRDCLTLNLYDWLVTALIAATGAIVGTWVAGILIYEEQFSLSYNPDLAWGMKITLIMIVSVCLVGFIACRRSLQVSISDLLKA